MSGRRHVAREPNRCCGVCDQIQQTAVADVLDETVGGRNPHDIDRRDADAFAQVRVRPMSLSADTTWGRKAEDCRTEDGVTERCITSPTLVSRAVHRPEARRESATDRTSELSRGFGEPFMQITTIGASIAHTLSVVDGEPSRGSCADRTTAAETVAETVPSLVRVELPEGRGLDLEVVAQLKFIRVRRSAAKTDPGPVTMAVGTGVGEVGVLERQTQRKIDLGPATAAQSMGSAPVESADSVSAFESVSDRSVTAALAEPGPPGRSISIWVSGPIPNATIRGIERRPPQKRPPHHPSNTPASSSESETFPVQVLHCAPARTRMRRWALKWREPRNRRRASRMARPGPVGESRLRGARLAPSLPTSRGVAR
jgi:hypothetical protein